MTGVSIKLRGVFKQLGAPDSQPNERKLYLFLNAGSSDALGKALGMLYNCFSTGSIFASAQPPITIQSQQLIESQQPQLFHNYTSQFAAPTQQQQEQQYHQQQQPPQLQQQQYGQYLQPPQILPAVIKPVYNCNARVSLGILSDARLDQEFKVKEKILGSGGQNLTHIENVTGVRAYLIGGGPLKAENGSWLEDFFLDLNAVSNDQLQQGVQLTSNLVETLRQEYVSLNPHLAQPTTLSNFDTNTYVPPPQQIPAPTWIPPPQQVPMQQAVSLPMNQNFAPQIPQNQSFAPQIHYVGFNNNPHLALGMAQNHQDPGQPYLHSQIRPMHPVHVPGVPVQKGRVPFSYPDSDGIVHVEGNGSTHRHEEENTGPVHYSDRRERPREPSFRDKRDDGDRYERESSSSSSRGRYDGRNNDRRDSDRDRGGGDRGDYRDRGDRSSDNDRSRDEKRDSDRRDSDKSHEKEVVEVKKRKRGFQESVEYISPQDIPIPKAIHNQKEKKDNVVQENHVNDTNPTDDELRIPTFTEPTESVLAALAAMTQRRKAKISRPLVPSFAESSPLLIDGVNSNKKIVTFSEIPILAEAKKKTNTSPSLLPGLIAYDDDDN